MGWLVLFILLLLEARGQDPTCSVDADCEYPKFCEYDWEWQRDFCTIEDRDYCTGDGTPASLWNRYDCLCDAKWWGVDCELGDVCPSGYQPSDVGVTISTTGSYISSGTLVMRFQQEVSDDMRMGNMSINAYYHNSTTGEPYALINPSAFTSARCRYETTDNWVHTGTHISSSGKCYAYYTLTISLTTLTSSCFALQTTSGGVTTITGRARTAHYVHHRGDPFDTIEKIITELPWTITLPSTITASSGSVVRVYEEPSVLKATLDASSVLGEVHLGILLAMLYPYKLVSITLSTNGWDALSNLTVVDCPEELEEPCLYRYDTVVPNNGSLCEVNGEYVYNITYGCQSQVASCPISGLPNSTQVKNIIREFPANICSEAAEEVSTGGSISSFADPQLGIPSTGFLTGSTGYFSVIVSSEAIISDITVANITVFSHDTGILHVLMQNGAPTPVGQRVDLSVNEIVANYQFVFQLVANSSDPEGPFFETEIESAVAYSMFTLNMVMEIEYSFQTRKRAFSGDRKIVLGSSFFVMTEKTGVELRRESLTLVLVICIVSVMGTIHLTVLSLDRVLRARLRESRKK